MKKYDTYSISLSAVLAALGGALVIIGGFFEILDLTAASLASIAVIAAIEELTGKFPFLVYAVSSAAALIFMPLRSATAYYVFFLGYYPILKPVLDALKKRIGRALVLLIKLAVFDVSLTLVILLSKLFIGTDELYTPTLLISTVVLANVFFIAYDLFVGVIAKIYRLRFAGKLIRRRH